MATTYILRSIDPELWEKFKARVASEGRGQKYVVLRLIELYSSVGLAALERIASSKKDTH
jgi:hypothetical protein